MKKLIIVFLILLSSGVVYSADYAESFADYRSQIKSNLNINTSNTSYVTDTVMNQMIRQAVIMVNASLRPIKNRISITTTHRVGVYSLDTTVLGVIDVSWHKNDSVKTFLFKPKTYWYQGEVQSTFGKKGYEARPSYYDFIDDEVYLYPAPFVTGDTITITAWQKVQDLAKYDNLSTIPQQYRVPIVLYATYLIALSKQHPSTATYLQNYVNSISAINKALNEYHNAQTDNN